MPFKGRVYVPPPLPPPPPTYAKRQVLMLELIRGDRSLALPLSADVDNHVWCVGPGVEGLDLPASDLIQQGAAGMYGSFDTAIDVPARDVFLPVQLKAVDMEDWFVKRDQFNDLTRPYQRLPVRIRSTRPNGVVRWIDGHRVRTTPTWELGTWVPRAAFQKFGLTIVCPDPWWRGEETIRIWQQQGVSEDFFPILPVRLSASRVFGVPVQIQVNGAVEASPEWIAEGPFTALTATHVESGRTWTLTANVTAGQTVVINADPRYGALAPRVTGPAGTSWWNRMTPPVDLWPVPPGTQTILVEVTGTDGDTKITMRTPSLWETV